MAIEPTKNDIGRRVRLNLHGGPSLLGKLVELEPWVKVRFEDHNYPLATDPQKLEWADGVLL